MWKVGSNDHALLVMDRVSMILQEEEECPTAAAVTGREEKDIRRSKIELTNLEKQLLHALIHTLKVFDVCLDSEFNSTITKQNELTEVVKLVEKVTGKGIKEVVPKIDYSVHEE